MPTVRALALLAGLVAFRAAAQEKVGEGLDALLGEADADLDAGAWASATLKLKLALALAKDRALPGRVDAILDDLVDAGMASGDLDLAYQAQKELLERTLDKDDPLASVEASMRLATIAFKLRLHKETDKQLRYAETLYTELGNVAGLAKVAVYRAMAAEARGEYGQTVEWYAKARELYRDAGFPRESALQLLATGNVLKEFLSQFDLALKHYDQALAELEAQALPDDALAVRIDKGNALVDMGRIEAALDLLGRTQAAVDSRRAPRAWARASQMLAKARYRAGQYHEATALIEGILTLLPEVRDLKDRALLEVDALNLRAMIAADLGRYPEAFAAFERAVGKARQHGLRPKQAQLHNNVGYWLRETGRAREAAAEHERALSIDRELKSDDGIAFDLRNLGLARLASGHLEEAAKLLNEALALGLRIGGAYNLAHTYLGLGELALKQGKWPAAVAHFKRAVEIATEGQLIAFSWQAHAGLALAAIQQGERELSRQHFRRAIDVIDSLEAALRTDEARRDFKESPRVRQVYEAYQRMLEEAGLQREAETVRRRSKPRRIGDLDSI